MNNCKPEDMTIQLKAGDKPVRFGDMHQAYVDLPLAQADLDYLRKELVMMREALTMVCGLVLETVGQIEPKNRTEKEKVLIQRLDDMGLKVL